MTAPGADPEFVEPDSSIARLCSEGIAISSVQTEFSRFDMLAFATCELLGYVWHQTALPLLSHPRGSSAATLSCLRAKAMLSRRNGMMLLRQLAHQH